MQELAFIKYQGTGNDFIMIDDRSGHWQPQLTREAIAGLCHRRFGIGADGLILLAAHPEADFRMVYFNADGNESTMCGNGGRCLVDFAHHLDVIQETARFEAIDGWHEARWESQQVWLAMTRPQGYQARSDQEDWIDTGSPHLLLWQQEGLSATDVQGLGALHRYDQAFAPGGTNVNFLQTEDEDTLRIRTYERGVEAETLSCGTGATAAAYVHLLRQNRAEGQVRLHTPGGTLRVAVTDLGQATEQVWLIGPATPVFSGTIPLPFPTVSPE